MPANTSAILSFGRYLPRYRIKTAEIARHWEQDPDSLKALGVTEKTVPGRDEDSFTLAFEASTQALERSGIKSTQISACFAGSESHVYAVKPTSGMLVAALGLDPFSHCADLEFACKAGTAAMQIVDSMIRVGQIEYGLAGGTDTAQAEPGDALEYTAAAGAAAILLGPVTSKKALCRIDHTLSFTTDTPDFWRAANEDYPRHAGRFTGEPGYFHHVREALKGMLEIGKIEANDIAHLVLHMPNGKFPLSVAKEFGFSKEQLNHGFIIPKIGNTYSACSLLGLTEVLQHATKDERILLVSYGSGAGADAFLMTMLRDGIALPVDEREVEYLSYAEYQEHVRGVGRGV